MKLERKILKKKSRKKGAILSCGTTSGNQVHNMHVTRILKGKVRKGATESILCIGTRVLYYQCHLGNPKNILEDLMTKIFPNLIKTINQKFQEAQAPSTRNVRKNTPRHITVKLLRTSCEKKILKANKNIIVIMYQETKLWKQICHQSQCKLQDSKTTS